MSAIELGKSMSHAPAYLVEALAAGMEAGRRAGGLMQTADDTRYSGRTVRLHGAELLNFGCCSYLGLELREELQAGAIDAIRRFGTQFPFPRLMLQSPLYEDLTSSLCEMTGGHVVVAPSTTLAHIAALPVLVAANDAVIVDVAAHASLHTALALLSDRHVEPLRHNQVELLEARVRQLAEKHERVWYVFDGLYSILGEFAPIEELAQLMRRFPALHLYVDDAHSTSWTGLHGRGYALQRLAERDRVVAALSLNKAFGAGGGALVFAESRLADRVLRAGGPIVFSGAVQPPLLGAAAASARIHLSSELPELQARLQAKLALAISEARNVGVPLADETMSPIFFLRCGSRELAFDLTRRMRARGFCVGPAIHPVVPHRREGIRFCITLHNDDEDIRQLMTAFATECSALGLSPNSLDVASVAAGVAPEYERKPA